MALQITGGYLKGRRLAAVKGRVRPTAAKVREAIFNILGPAVAGARVLDLFAGTGALGLEALSRGGREAVFVAEHSRRDALPEVINRLHLQKVRRYGDTQVAFYICRENEERQEIDG